MGSVRVKGNALSLLVDGVDHWADVTSIILDGEFEESRDFCGRPRTLTLAYWFEVQAVQSTAPGSFWTFLYEHQNQDLPFGYAPHGNPTPSEEEPHFTGILTTPGHTPLLGGPAGRNTSQTFTTRLHIIQGPLRVTTP